MPGKGKFSGFNWHHEFHTVDPKKEKAADCIYLTKDRICRKGGCPKKGEKCFVATYCKYRVKAADAPKPVQPKPEWKCSLPKYCDIFSKSHGVGTYISCDTKNHLITIKFDTCVQSYKYPDAFLQQHLYGAQAVTDAVLTDTRK